MILCNNFRGVNAISTFDAYPMPRVDELLERLGKAKFITGYYHRFIPGYATIANPVTNLIKKNLPNQVEWKDETEEMACVLIPSYRLRTSHKSSLCR